MVEACLPKHFLIIVGMFDFDEDPIPMIQQGSQWFPRIKFHDFSMIFIFQVFHEIPRRWEPCPVTQG